MALIPILKFPNPRLRSISNPVTVFDQKLKTFAADMLETMIDANGAGLAAPQVGHLKRIIIVTSSTDRENYGEDTLTLVNPKVINSEGIIFSEEGCLSVIDLNAKVRRFNAVTVRAQDLDGAFLEVEASGRLAIVLQHEIDHLNGILFIDYLNKETKEAYLRHLQKIKSA
ncbi:MAG: peptide deformylase [Deltaproteobacteria bacterium]|jgi:peptide deformylase|nr:peptide deformylase [Deltaproteobacteria bacterium]